MLTTDLLAGRDPTQALNAVVDVVPDLAGADAAALLVPAPQPARSPTATEPGDTLRVAAALGEPVDHMSGQIVPIAYSVSGLALAAGDAVAVEDITTDPRTAASILARMGIGPAVAAPLGGHPTPGGVLAVCRRSGRRPFGPAEVAALTSFATHLGLVLELAQQRAGREQLQLQHDRDRIAAQLQHQVGMRLLALSNDLAALASRPTDTSTRRPLAAYADTLQDIARQLGTTVYDL